ncbi:uncharacterized protein SPAPADRAFT_53380 [Spathaspora passalidarum NRRL Y-27907]|uniref:Central kinetochore subunit CHL4 n=1 Tax=Spathaspora passalidarum (strain NRRL Y-27907 / 11-Y1) TaxID=619300 RepID=G3AFN3_SPAPN|nr:uncharacterized protein SPAPADRAFT_53380 [Spathaspora passalidarum NRRL Y-27907]EGW35022.1 hypothetical protein SPAPADRAFT_53380 [Spathaspora passalidarum NRRL Y-27907]
MKKKQNYKNVLPNTYIPVLSKKVLYNVLTRLSKPSLIEFIHLWPKLKNTQPHIPPKTSFTQSEFNDKVSREAREFKKTINKLHKKKIIDKILFTYWHKGLNLLQLSQIDCQLIVDRPNSYYWGYSTVRDMNDNEVPISLDPVHFLDQLAFQLSKLYLSYVYICRHPKFPMVLIRIQAFDLHTKETESRRPHISSHKPYFFAIPLNSPHIIHSGGGDMIHNIVMEVVERSLPQDKTNILRLYTPENQRPIKSLESMHILKGNSRFANSLGSWSAYADNIVDMLPLQPTEKHKQLASPEEPINAQESPIERLKRVANLRFKGSEFGKLKSEKLFEDSRKSTRKRRNVYYTNDSDDEGEEEGNSGTSEFASIAPIQYSEFLIHEKVTPQDKERTSIKIKLSGTDVFAGLHELSVMTADPEEMILNPEDVPSWLTGEEGASVGQIIDSKFYSNIK